jgi:hypothetical protein
MSYVKTIQRKHISTLEILALIEAAWQLGINRRQMLEVAYAHVPWRVLHAKLNQIDDLQFIDWGVSMYQAWLTDKGRAYLEAANDPA